MSLKLEIKAYVAGLVAKKHGGKAKDYQVSEFDSATNSFKVTKDTMQYTVVSKDGYAKSLEVK